MFPKKLIVTSLVIELAGIALMSTGIGVELAMGADGGYLLITGGAVIVAIGSLLWVKVLRRR